MAPSAALLAFLSLAAPAPAGMSPDPCMGARASFPARVEGVSDDTLHELASYREAWRRACDPKANPADLDGLLGDAETLSGDVILSRVLDVINRMLPRNAPWPLPGLRRRGRADFVPDWAAFVRVAEQRGKAEDQRFWRAAALVADENGDPAWLGPGEGEEPCVRLGEMPWPEVAEALGQMETARSERYSAHGRRLRERLVETLVGLERGNVCGCVRGDAAAELEPLAAAREREKLGTAARRAITTAATTAFDALRKGPGKVRWLRDAPGAPATGCGAKGP